VTQVVAGTRDLQCLNYLLGPKNYSDSNSFREQKNTMSQVVTGTRDIQCLKQLLGPEM